MQQAVRTEQAAADALERCVLEIVRALVVELGDRPRGSVTARASLDRDLGIGSLERVELLLRLEQEFGVRLPDAVMAEAESPRDLVQAIRVAAPVQPEPAPETRLPPMPAPLSRFSAGTPTPIRSESTSSSGKKTRARPRSPTGRSGSARRRSPPDYASMASARASRSP